MVEKTTLSEIVRRNTNITQVPRHVFYSTKLCKDVENEQCIPYLCNSSTPEPNCENELPLPNLTKTVQLLRNKSYALENKLTLNENEKQNLKTQLTSWQQKYYDRCNSNLENNVTTLKQENEILRNSVTILENTHAKTHDSKHDETLLVLLIALVCALLISTAIFCVLYLKVKKQCKALLYPEFESRERKSTENTSV